MEIPFRLLFFIFLIFKGELLSFHLHCCCGSFLSPAIFFFLIAGAPIAGSAIDQVKEVVGYVSLGYPFGILASVLFGRHNKACLQSEKPKLFVMGTSDGFTSVKQLENKLKTAAGRIETKLVPGVGHFQLEGPDYDNLMIDFVTEFADSIVQNQPEASSSSDLYSSAD